MGKKSGYVHMRLYLDKVKHVTLLHSAIAILQVHMFAFFECLDLKKKYVTELSSRVLNYIAWLMCCWFFLHLNWKECSVIHIFFLSDFCFVCE